jgi:hypothetical protein
MYLFSQKWARLHFGRFFSSGHSAKAKASVAWRGLAPQWLTGRVMRGEKKLLQRGIMP